MAGQHGLLAFWMGGAGSSASAPAPQGSITSLLAPWLGGAGAPSVPTIAVGATGLLAFWMGGASAGPTAPEPPIFIGGRAFPERLRRVRDDDEELLMLIATITAGWLM